MPGKDEIVAGIRLEGEKEFKAGVSDVNRSIKTMNSELKLVTEQYRGQANSLEALTAKQEVMNKILAEQKRKLEATDQGLKNAQKNYEKAGEGVERLWKQMEKEADKLEEVKKLYGDTSDEAASQQKAVDKLSAEIEKQEALYRKAGNSVKDWEARLNYANAQAIKTSGEINEISQYMREAEQSTDGCAKSIDEFGRKIGKVETDTFWDTFKANLSSDAIIGGIKAVAGVAKEGAEALVDMATEAAAYADEILTASTVTGMSTEDLQAYNYAAELVDVSLETLTKSMAKNIKSMDSARKGSKDYAEAYKKLGVEVTDADGNLRDSEEVYWECIDALGAMTDETERDAVSMQLFGKSAQDLNPLIEKGSAGIAALKDEAKEMGAVLDQDALTALGGTDDALQKLNQQTDIFKRTVGARIAPVVEDVAEAATKMLDGLSEAINPPKSDLEKFIEDIKAANDEARETLENAQNTMSGAESEVGNLEAYKDTLLELNSETEKTEFQKFQMKQIVSDLASSIPELAAAYDEETGSIKLTNTEIKNLIENQEALLLQQAAMEAQQDAYKALFDAEMNAAKATSAAKEAQDEYNESWQYWHDLSDAGNAEAQYEAERLEGNLKTANAELEEANRTATEAEEAYNSFGETLATANQKMSEATGISVEVIESNQKTADSYEDEADAAENSADRSATAAKASADAQKAALQSVRDEFDSLKEDIQQATDSKISLFDAFDGGDEVSLDDMKSNMVSYADGIKQYYDDLETLSKDVGSGITQEFFQYLSDLGPEGANVIHEITEAWTTGSREDRKKIQDMMYNQLQALDASEQGAEIQARNQTLIDEAFNVNPPDPSKYDGLFDTLNQALAEGAADESAAVEKGLRGAVETARKVGAEIPEGVAEAISSGDIDSAVAALNGSVQGRLEGLAEMARDAGMQIPDEITAGIQSGDTGAMAAAYDQLVSAISENVDTSALSQVIGDAAGEAAPEIEGHSDDVGTAAGNVAQAGADAASEKQSEFKTAGDDAGATYVEALRAHLAEGARAAGALASTAQNAIASYRNAFQNAGYNLSAGVAQGIRDGGSGIVSAMVSQIQAAERAAKSAAQIASPSKKFRKEIGQQIGNGVAFGIRDKASLAGNEAARMSSQVYSKATAWLSKYKKSHEVSLDDEQYYWDQVLQHVKKGTAAYNNAIKKLAVATFSGTDLSGSAATAAMKKIESNFGVSRKKTTGTGKNKKTVKKDAESYYSEIYNAANKYISNMQTLNDWSLQAELSYWTAVQAQLKKGTQAWYDAAGQIRDLQAEIAEAQQEAAEAAEEAEEERIRTLQSVHSKMLGQYRTYFQVSAKAEMDYWDIARKQFAEGTDARIEADQAYLEAREEYYDRQTELDEDYAEKKQKVDDELADSIKDLQDAYDDAVKSREKEIKSSMNLFEAWDAEGWDSGKLMSNLKTQVDGLKFWEDQLDELSKKGVTQELMDELAAMGPDAAANLWSLNQMTAEQLDEYQRLWTEKNELAHKQALEDNKNLLKETQDSIAEARKTAQDELAGLKKDYDDAVAELNTGLSDGLKSLVTQAEDVGEEIVSSLVEAVRSGMTDVTGLVAQAKQQAAEKKEAQQQAEAQKAAARQAEAQKAAEQQAAQAEKDNVLSIIEEGKKRSKTLTKAEKGNSDLWRYIVQHYGRQPYSGITKKLGDAMGIKVSKDPTAKQQKEVLEALKKRGLATGARNIWRDELAWMLENAKTEYVVRTADKAVLQPMRAGDKVINPKGAENLYDFAENPTEFISARARDALAVAREAMQKHQDEMRRQIPELDYGGITRLNRLMESGMQQAPVVNVDNKELVSMMQQMVSGMQSIMGQMQELQERQIVMDSGALVGALQQPLSRANAAVQRRRNRGTLR